MNAITETTPGTNVPTTNAMEVPNTKKRFLTLIDVKPAIGSVRRFESFMWQGRIINGIRHDKLIDVLRFLRKMGKQLSDEAKKATIFNKPVQFRFVVWDYDMMRPVTRSIAITDPQLKKLAAEVKQFKGSNAWTKAYLAEQTALKTFPYAMHLAEHLMDGTPALKFLRRRNMLNYYRTEFLMRNENGLEDQPTHSLDSYYYDRYGVSQHAIQKWQDSLSEEVRYDALNALNNVPEAINAYIDKHTPILIASAIQNMQDKGHDVTSFKVRYLPQKINKLVDFYRRIILSNTVSSILNFQLDIKKASDIESHVELQLINRVKEGLSYNILAHS